MRAPFCVVFDQNIVGLVGKLVVVGTYKNMDVAIKGFNGYLLAFKEGREDVCLPITDKVLDIVGRERV